MGFIGLIRLLALVLIVWLVWRFLNRRGLLGNTPQQRVIKQTMVECSYCQTHVPREDAVEHQGSWYCCPEHRDQDGAGP